MKISKKFIIISLLLIIILPQSVHASNNRDIDIMTLVPVRDVLNKAEIEFIWNNETKSVNFINKNKIVKLKTTIEKKEDNNIYELFIINGKGYLKIEDFKEIGITFEYLNSNSISLTEKVMIGDEIPIIESDVLSKEDLYILNESPKKRIIFFWATWCPYCDEYIKEIKKLSNNSDLDIIAINVDEKLNQEKVKEKIKESLNEVINILDINKEIVNKYNPEGIPATYILDDNIVIDNWFGVINEKDILERIQK